MPKIFRHFVIVLGLLILAILLLIISHVFLRNERISSFDDCEKAGNPVMESYPRQCRANGQTFVEEID